MGNIINSIRTWHGNRDIYRDYDNPERLQYVRSILKKKYAVNRWYKKVYSCYVDAYKELGANGAAVEIGSGASFAK